MKKLIFLFLIVLLSSTYGFSQSHVVKGEVISQDNSPLPGATVTALKSHESTITNDKGKFSLSIEVNDTLIVSYIGYETKRIPVQLGENPVISLKASVGSLNELVVTGYQKERKKDLLGAVSVVDVSKIEKSSTNNAVKALQGHVPGVYVSTDGNPNGAASIQIRGTTTLNDNSPLFIIDGIPTKGGLNELNMNDIESIQVLKDPSSASIYGARASNGVIIITTKKGQKGKTKINFSSSLTTEQYTTKLSVLNTEQRGRVLWRAAINDGVDPANLPIYKYKWHKDNNGIAILDKVIVPKWIDSSLGIQTANTNWFDEISRLGFIQNYNISLSTGGDKGVARFSLGYFNNKGIVKENDFKRITARINSEYHLLGGALKIGENFFIAGSQEHPMPSGAGGTPLNLALIVQPVIPVHTVNGGWGGPWGAGFDDRDNPVRLIEDNKWNFTDILSVMGNAYMNLTILKNLNFNSSFGINYNGNYGKAYNKTYQSGFLGRDINSLNVGQNHNVTWTWHNTLNYRFRINEHDIRLLAGMEVLRNAFTGFSAYREEFALETPDYFYLDAGTGNKSNGGTGGGYSLLSYFGKVDYQYKGKYLASATVRRDGSSRFGKNNKFGFFPAFSLGWRLSQENFIKNNLSFLSDLKLRFGWGQTGNQQIDNNAIFALYLPNYGDDDTWGPGNGTAYDISGNGSGTLPSGFYAIQRGNSNLKWETTTGTNYGIDFGFFDQKLYGSFDYYIKNTTDILIRPPYAGVIGDGGSKWVNGASLKNQGFEIILAYRNKVGNLNYDISANLGHYSDKITELPEDVINSYPGNSEKTIIGRSPNSLFGYVTDGLFTTQKEVDNSAEQPGKGLGRIRYKDLNDDGKINALDQDYIGVAEPQYMYGINLSLDYKNFDLSLFFQGVKGMWVNNTYATYTDFASMWSGANYGTRTLNAWTPQNPHSTIPALTLADNNSESRFSTYYVQKGDYLKWRSVNIGYNFTPGILKIKGIENFRVYLQGENLLILKNNNGKRSFTGPDPENPAAAFPRPLKLTVGLNITL